MFMSKDENYKPQAFIGSIAKIPILSGVSPRYARGVNAFRVEYLVRF
jgi:hypothetical protein